MNATIRNRGQYREGDAAGYSRLNQHAKVCHDSRHVPFQTSVENSSNERNDP
jgi:hypothetical protein